MAHGGPVEPPALNPLLLDRLWQVSYGGGDVSKFPLDDALWNLVFISVSSPPGSSPGRGGALGLRSELEGA